MLWALIMAGGQGTRLWPLSTPEKPKPFLKLIPGKETLLEETLLRLKPIIPAKRVFLIGNEEHFPLLRKFGSKIPKNQIIGEPVLKNTAPTIALAASLIRKKDPKAVLLVLPSDHWIGNVSNFVNSIKKAAKCENQFCIFGVKATFPSSNFGYLRAGKKVANGIFRLEQFVEKPTVIRAKQFLKTNKYFWHAGIFLAPVSLILESIKKYQPILYQNVQKLSIENGAIVPSSVFLKLPKISIDYAVLERLKDANMIYSDCDWSDIGTWETLAALWASHPQRKKEEHLKESFGAEGAQLALSMFERNS